MSYKNNGWGNKQTGQHSDFDIKKYIKIFTKRKKLILLTTLVVGVLWSVFVLNFMGSPTYQAQVVLGFEDPRKMGDMTDSRGRSTKENESKARLARTRVLLANVVKRLNLNVDILTEGLDLDKAIKYVYADRNSIPGYYKLVIHGQNVDVIYSNPEDDIDPRKIATISVGDTLKINHFTMFPNWEYLKLKDVKEFEFKIREFDRAIEDLWNKISYSLDRTRIILTLIVKDKDPERAALIANTLADEYIKFNLAMKRRRTEEIMKILENQLKIAKEDLDKSNERLKKFKEENPWVVLSNDANMPLTQITNLNNRINSINLKIKDVQNLLKRIAKVSNFDEKITTYRELLTYLSSQGFPTAPALEAEFEELNNERNSIIGNYAPAHPVVKENEKKFKILCSKIEKAAKKFIRSLKAEKQRILKDIEQEKFKLTNLPSKELTLAELTRDRDVKENLYSTLLSKYNKAKIAYEVEVPDVFLIDEATPPMRAGKMLFVIKNILLGLIIGFLLGGGLAVVLEFFDKTVQDSHELQKKLPLPIIGNIPFIEVKEPEWEELEDDVPKQDAKLITLDYSPTIASEAYRELRTKVLFQNQSKKVSILLITSLGPGEGKSLTISNLAITIAQQKIPTLLIDGDLRRGVLHNEFGDKKRPGLSDFLVSNATIDYDNLSKIIQQTMVPNLFLISSGSQVPNPAEIIGSQRMKDILQVLRGRFGMILIDSAPFQSTPDAAVLANYADAVILVVKAGYTNVELLGDKVREYQPIRDKLMGVVLNGVKVNLKKHYYKYSYYNY